MDKYGLSTNVLSTYLRDFHGVTVGLARKQGPDILSYEAVCTDCHGIHNIVSTELPSSPVLKETCWRPAASATPGPRRASPRRGFPTTNPVSAVRLWSSW